MKDHHLVTIGAIVLGLVVLYELTKGGSTSSDMQSSGMSGGSGAIPGNPFPDGFFGFPWLQSGAGSASQSVSGS